MLKVTITRSEWTGIDVIDGIPTVESKLLVDNSSYQTGHRCCLGFLCQQIGFRDEQIRGLSYTKNIDSDEVTQEQRDILQKLAEKFYYGKSLEEEIAEVNDHHQLSCEQKELKLTNLFKKHLETELKFVD